MKEKTKDKKIVLKNKKIKKQKFHQQKPNIDKEIDMDKMDVQLIDLEKNILENPNNSKHWILYLSYIAEDKFKFRKEIERAILQINSEQMQDILNIWKCYLNFEFEFGDENKFVQVFKRALNSNDRSIILEHVVNLYVQKRDYEQAYEITKLYLKKPEDKIQSWLKQIEFLIRWKQYKLENGDEQDSEEIAKEFDEKIKFNLKRSLQSLDKNLHIKFLCQYSIAEYKNNNYQVGRMNFENIISNFPKKTNIWNLYLDMEIKYVQNQQYIRNLFNKVCLLPLKLPQIKGFYKKYFQYEQQFGDNKSQNQVKKKAQEYVQSLQK